MMTATVMVATMFFSGCQKDKDSLVSGDFNGLIATQVESGNAYDQYFKQVWVLIGPQPNGTNLTWKDVIAKGSYSNGGFTVNLPATVKSQHLTSISDYFETNLKVSGKLKYSSPSARIIDVELFAFDDENGWYDYFVNCDADKKPTYCFYVFVDEDVDVTGGPTVSFKQGWNRLYYSSDKNLVTTKDPGKMKWFISQDL
jgi:hypothetical protein